MGFFTALQRAFLLRCPRCGKGKLFKGVFAMNKRCPVCNYKFEREEGYYTGAMAINLVISELLVAAYILPISVWAGLDPKVPFIPILLLSSPLPVLLPLLFFRPTRGLWVNLNYLFDPPLRDQEREPVGPHIDYL